MVSTPDPRPQDAAERDDEFDGCSRECRRAGAHTREWGRCEHGIEPEPSLSVTRVVTASDGYLSIVTRSITLTDLADRIERALRRVPGGEYRDMALAVAKDLINGDEEPDHA